LNFFSLQHYYLLFQRPKQESYPTNIPIQLRQRKSNFKTMDDSATSKAVKAAKKILKKQDSGSMKLKELAKLVAEEMGDGDNHKKVKKCIAKSDKFSVEGKEISLSKKQDKKRSVEADSNTPSSKKARVSKDESVTSTSDNNKSLSLPETWRKDNKIMVKHCKDGEEGIKLDKIINNDEDFFPLTSFDQCKSVVDKALIRQCTEGNGFQKPSPIQAQSWPILCKKRDIVGIAETGSGKTLAFSIPALSSMLSEGVSSNKRLPRMLVLSPTRELAMQVEVVLQEYGAVIGLNSLVLYGGVPKWTQAAELKKGRVDCIVATPGRLKDLINDGICDLSKIHHLVLDEADRMLDMGFEG
jgi:ATP-dependent RNA helicase DBP3